MTSPMRSQMAGMQPKMEGKAIDPKMWPVKQLPLITGYITAASSEQQSIISQSNYSMQSVRQH